MHPWLKRIYDLTPAPVQSALVSAFSARLGRARYGGRFPEFRALLQDSQWWDAAEDGRVAGCAAARTSCACLRARALLPRAIQAPRHRSGKIPRPRRPSAYSGADPRHRQEPHRRSQVARRKQDLAPGHGHTSGTTGSPLSVYYSSDAITMNYAVMDRALPMGGLTPRARRRSRRRGARQRHRAAGAEARAVLAPQPQPQPAADVELPPDAGQPDRATTRRCGSSSRASSMVIRRRCTCSPRCCSTAASGCRCMPRSPRRRRSTTSSARRSRRRSSAACSTTTRRRSAWSSRWSATTTRAITSARSTASPRSSMTTHQPLAAGHEGVMVGTSLHNIGMPMIRYLHHRSHARSSRSPAPAAARCR